MRRQITWTIPLICTYHGWPQPHSQFDLPQPPSTGRSLRPFVFDWAWPELKIAIEQDGGIYRRGGGAHSRPRNILRDMDKGNLAQLMGWRWFRFTPEWISTGRIIPVMQYLFDGAPLPDGRNMRMSLPRSRRP